MAVTVAATIDALKGGVSKIPASAALANIDSWHTTLNGVPGAETICADLASLKRHLQATPPDSKALASLLGKIGQETTKLAAGAKGDDAPKLKELGTMLTSAGGH